MKVTIVGCGDAWGTGGRIHTCFRVDMGGRCTVVDFGASALVGWHRLGLNANDIDAIVLSHLHGDHFGGIPFLLLESQFELNRTRPLQIVGPPGTRARVAALCDAFFPGLASREWRFAWSVVELTPGEHCDVAGLDVTSAKVVHSSGSPSTAVRISDGRETFAYSGDTEWTEALVPIADGADVFIVECYSGQASVPGHLDWPCLAANLPRLRAGQIAITHMGRSALAETERMRAAGVIVCTDGHVIDT